MRARLYFLGTIGCAVLFQTTASAAITHLSQVDRTALLQQKFDVEKTVSAIPKSVRDEFARAVESGTFSMANPDQPFQSSTSSGTNVPFYRLVFAASNEHYYLIEALRGGSTPGSEVFLFQLQPSQSKQSPFVIHEQHGSAPHSGGALVFDSSPSSAKLVWSAVEQTTAGDLNGIRKSIAADKMSDNDSDLASDRAAQPSGANINASPVPTMTATW